MSHNLFQLLRISFIRDVGLIKYFEQSISMCYELVNRDKTLALFCNSSGLKTLPDLVIPSISVSLDYQYKGELPDLE